MPLSVAVLAVCSSLECSSSLQCSSSHDQLTVLHEIAVADSEEVPSDQLQLNGEHWSREQGGLDWGPREKPQPAVGADRSPWPRAPPRRAEPPRGRAGGRPRPAVGPQGTGEYGARVA